MGEKSVVGAEAVKGCLLNFKLKEQCPDVPNEDINKVARAIASKAELTTREGKRSKRSENSLRTKLKDREYTDEEIESIMDIRNTEFVIKRENGEDIVLKRHGYLKEEDGQSHHLNQDAAFKDVIPTDEAITIKLEGNILTEKDSSHYKAHEAMEAFWDDYREPDGKYMDEMPTIQQYNEALNGSMLNAGFTNDEADLIVEVAAHQQRAFGLNETDDVLRIPGKINSIERKD